MTATSETVHYKGIFDDKGRMMVIICHNTDLGDGWEREGEERGLFPRVLGEEVIPDGDQYRDLCHDPLIGSPAVVGQASRRTEDRCQTSRRFMRASARSSRRSTRAAAGSSTSWQGDRRPEGGDASAPDQPLRRRPLPDHRRPGPGQDAAGPHHRAGLPSQVPAHPVHPRPDAGRHHRHRDPRGNGRRPPPDAVRQGPDLRQRHPGRRDQPDPAQDPGRPPGSDAGTPGDRRRRPLSRWRSRSSSWPRRTRSRWKGPIRCPRPSSTGSCST